MKKLVISALALSLASFLGFAGNEMAISFGDNITLYDGTEDGIHTGVNAGQEDQETESGMVTSQAWDLEGFILNNPALSMVGGFDFNTGVPGYSQFSSGDIFIDGEGFYDSSQAPEGFPVEEGNNTVQGDFGYEYVFDSVFDKLICQILKFDFTASTITAYYPANENNDPGSNQWQYSSGGGKTGSDDFFSITRSPDADTGLLADTKYVPDFDLDPFLTSLVPTTLDFPSPFTMGRGNDNLMGQGTADPIPEPATLLLFGIGLAGLATVGRKKMKHA